MTVEPAPCEPTWRDQPDTDNTPTPGLQRIHEIADQRGQAATPRALWTAHTVPTGRYL